MAVSQSLLTSGGDATDAASFTTASITPSPYKVVIVGVASIGSNDAVVSGCGMAWTRINSAAYFTGTYKTTLYWGMAPNPSIGALTISFSGQNQGAVAWIVTQLTNVDVYNPIIQNAIKEENTNQATVTVTLAAFSDADNATLGMFGGEGAAFNINPGAGFTEVAETSFYDTVIAEMEFLAGNDTTVDVTRTAGTGKWGGVAVELRENPNPPKSGGAFLMNFI